ncbi:MAG TPA: hypothetical protein VK217_04330 [Acidimicrobiales bacterium]|nr:hypothetical protein [Acidimicrobiales bacterium]
MKPSHLFRNRVVAIAGGLTVIALAAGGVAYATTPSTTASSSAPPPAVAAAKSAPADLGGYLYRHPLLGLFRHTVHAELIVGTKYGYETVIIDRGTLDTVSSTSITITRPDGPMVTASIGTSTRFRGLLESKLAAGDRVVLVQIGGRAVLVGALPPVPSASASSGASAAAA